MSALSESVYNPTEVRLINRAIKYISNQNIVVFSPKNNETHMGIIVLDLSNGKEIVILDIAVLNRIQKSGIGSFLINHCVNLFIPNEINAGTDGDTVGFYEKIWF